MHARILSLPVSTSIVCAYCLASGVSQWTYLDMSRGADGQLPVPTSVAVLMLLLSQAGQLLTWLLGTAVLLGSARYTGVDTDHLQWKTMLTLTAEAHLPLVLWAGLGAVSLLWAGEFFIAFEPENAQPPPGVAYARAFERFAALQPWSTTAACVWLAGRLMHVLRLRLEARSLAVVLPLLVMLAVSWTVWLILGGGR